MPGTYIYECDPDKNTECSKVGCYLNGGCCLFTTKQECGISPNNVGTVEDFPHVVHDGDDSAKKLHGIIYIPKEGKSYLYLNGVRGQSYD